MEQGQHTLPGDWAADWEAKLVRLVVAHGPYLLASTLVWSGLYAVSGSVSRWGSATYRGLPERLRTQWNVRVVALTHALIITVMAIWGLLYDELLRADHLHGRSALGYATMATTCGYFLWDLAMCLVYYHEFQLGFLLHAIGCLLTYLGSLDGVLMYYGYFYLTFEASTPFLNFHWFMDKMGVPNANLFKRFNAALLVLSFFVFRIVSGCGYSMFVVWQDIDRYIATSRNMANVCIMYYYYFAILLLNGLNCYWFYSIIQFATRAPKAPPSASRTAAADKDRKQE